MTDEEVDLIRWLYVVPGFSRARLSHDFGLPLTEIDRIVNTGLAEVLNPGRTHKAPGVIEFGASLPRDTDLYRSVLRDVFTPMGES